MEIISTRKLNDHLYQLSENISSQVAVQMYLVVGSQKAALIDSGYGLSGDLDKVVRTITDLPVTVLLTHCDPDHAGGAALFDDIYMNAQDQVLMDKGSIEPAARFGTAAAMAEDEAHKQYFKEHMVKAKKFTYSNINNGEIFNLGDRQLIALSLPGHTKGSMCFWNKEEGYCLVGDSVANVYSPVLFFKKCTPLEDYLANLINFLTLVGTDCKLYTGHNTDALPKDVILEIVPLCKEVIDGKVENDTPYKPPFMKDAPEDATIKERVRARVIGRFVTRKELGDAQPMEHQGKKASIKYNAKKIHHFDH